jgi:hypothetical protein
MSEVSLYRLRPRARLGAWPSLLSQKGKDGCRSLPESTRSKQPKVPNSMLIAFRNMLGPTVNKLFQGAFHFNLATQPFVFVPKSDGSFPDPRDTTTARWEVALHSGRRIAGNAICPRMIES